ncbi:MAG TPA: endonuclease/exonuclease/phosphatase family protein [Kofleriaceae bacterium]|nr:endonuclease/exonuclease/phosphatase family protein [Kofleriaceae bacterium]
MKLACAALALIGCVDVADQGGPWEDASSVNGVSIGPAPALRATPGCTLRIASWNVHKLPDANELATALLATQEISRADVVLMQESSGYAAEPMPRTAQLAEALAMTWAHQPIRDLGDGGMQANAIMSRYPLDRVMVKRLPYIEQPYHAQPRGAIAADIIVGDKRVRVVSVHLDVRISISDRIRQLDPAVSELDEAAVIGGDFNTAPWQWIDGIVPLTSSEAVLGMKQAAALDDYMASRRFDGNVSPNTVTFPIPGFPMRLDNLYSRGVAVTAAGVEQSNGSDHYPLWVDIDLCAAP